MRLFVVQQTTDLSSLSSQLLVAGGKPAARSTARDAMLESIKTLNPQVDMRRIEAGTTLLLPDSAEIDDSASRPLGGAALADFTAAMNDGMATLGKRLRAGVDAAATDRTVVEAAFGSAAVGSNPALHAQLGEVKDELKASERRAQAGLRQVGEMQKAIAKQLKALEALLG